MAGGGASVIYRYGRGRGLHVCHGREEVHIQVKYMGCGGERVGGRYKGGALSPLTQWATQ